MNYRVLKPFRNIDGSFLRINDTVFCTPERAMILNKNGMIGGIVETAMINNPVRAIAEKELAIDKKPKRKRRKTKL